MANREVGNPNVLDLYLGRDITAACQPADILRSVHCNSNTEHKNTVGKIQG